MLISIRTILVALLALPTILGIYTSTILLTGQGFIFKCIYLHDGKNFNINSFLGYREMHLQNSPALTMI